MSTSYRANNATIADAVEAGWVVVETKKEGTVLLGPDGNYAIANEDVLDGVPVLWFERFGGNDVSDLATALDAVSEHEEGYFDGFDDE